MDMFEVESFRNAVMNAARKSKFTTADTHRELLALAKRLEDSMEAEKPLASPSDSVILPPSK